MKLLRLGLPDQERVCIVAADGVVRDLSGVVSPNMPYTAEVFEAVRGADLPTLPVVDPSGERLGSPIPTPGAVICVGLNYRDHAEETGQPIPEEPILFLKLPRTVVGPYDEVLIPRGSVKTDYEVELGIVIGCEARYVKDEAEAMACVAGYVVSHDVSEREYQLERGGQWDKGKNSETFNPLGPWFVSADEVADPTALGIRLWVNGELRQESNTRNLIFGIGELVRYISQFLVLRPGDVINTGTPAGVALGHPDPKPYLRAGDVVECEIDGLGRQRQTVGAA
jgi:2-keto-4-pentenoate hydratase/2-oxohepta-3-ene-1,7-dioic acid hydratase in catechol pathway